MIPSSINSDDDCSPAELIGEGGFPHSEIVGSKLAHSSPTLIAACHVLHRLYMPRHPRIALTSRLRVHTTNDNTGSDPKTRHETRQSSVRGMLGVDNNLSSYSIGRKSPRRSEDRQENRRRSRHRFEKPIHNVKDGLRSLDRDMLHTWCAAISLLHPWIYRLAAAV